MFLVVLVNLILMSKCFFLSGPSLRDMLVRASSTPAVCLRDEHKKEYISSGRRKPGRPREYRACDTGLSDGQSMEKNVVYCMSCSICDGLYIGETERRVRDRFVEDYRDVKTMKALRLWGAHYCREHQEVLSATMDPLFTPFVNSRNLGREESLPSRQLLEAMEIRTRQPSVNNDGGWRLIN